MGIDAAQVACGKYFRGQGGVGFRYAEMHEDASGELLQASLVVVGHEEHRHQDEAEEQRVGDDEPEAEDVVGDLFSDG